MTILQEVICCVCFRGRHERVHDTPDVTNTLAVGIAGGVVKGNSDTLKHTLL